MFTGHILALPAFYGILSVLAVVMVQLVNEVLRAFVFGYRYVDTLNTLGTWLSPVILFLEKLRVDRAWDTDGNLERAVFQGLGYGLIYALIGAALAAVALVLYRRRHLEGAGDVVTVRWVRPIFTTSSYSLALPRRVAASRSSSPSTSGSRARAVILPAVG